MTETSRLSKFFETQPNVMHNVTGPIAIMRSTNNAAYKNLNSSQLYCIQSFKPMVDRLNANGLTVFENLPDNAQVAIVELTRSKPENMYNVARAYQAISLGGVLIVDGAKTDGIESLIKAIKKLHQIQDSYSKAHGKTIWLRKASASNPFADWLTKTQLLQNSDGYYTVPGIFSSDGIDPASALLIKTLPNTIKGKGADLGAGWGYLSQSILNAQPSISQLDLYEAEKMALNCAQKNITDTRANFIWQDIINMPATRAYDFVIMNPPFHTTRKANPDIGQDFIKKAAKILLPKGELWMVANKQLPYETTLDNHFAKWSYLEQTNQFKVIYAKQPK